MKLHLPRAYGRTVAPTGKGHHRRRRLHTNDGAIRAYDSRDGSIVWEYDANRSFDTVNMVPANGGSFIGPGPTLVGGTLFVNSGYGSHGGRAGNVLLAFRAE